MPSKRRPANSMETQHDVGSVEVGLGDAGLGEDFQSPAENKGIEKKKRMQYCTFCKNHRILARKKNHSCPYLACECPLCVLQRKAQITMRHQQRIWRHQKQKLLQLTKEQESLNIDEKCQMCDKCRNHNELVLKKNHNCPFNKCQCEYCSLTFRRRELMKHLQRVRRSNLTCDMPVSPEEDQEQPMKLKVDRKGYSNACEDYVIDDPDQPTATDSTNEKDKYFKKVPKEDLPFYLSESHNSTLPHSTEVQSTYANNNSISPEHSYMLPGRDSIQHMPSSSGFPMETSYHQPLEHSEAVKFGADDVMTFKSDSKGGSPEPLLKYEKTGDVQMRNDDGDMNCPSNERPDYNSQKVRYSQENMTMASYPYDRMNPSTSAQKYCQRDNQRLGTHFHELDHTVKFDVTPLRIAEQEYAEHAQYTSQPQDASESKYLPLSRSHLTKVTPWLSSFQSNEIPVLPDYRHGSICSGIPKMRFKHAKIPNFPAKHYQTLE